MKVLVDNRRARHDYFFLDTYEAGIALSGGEVKSLRGGRGSLQDSFVKVREGEAYLMNAMIQPYNFSDNRNFDPKRDRKLLLHKREIEQIVAKSSGKSLTVVPTAIYDVHNVLKVRIAIAKGKQQYDKRAAIRERELKQRVEQEVANRLKR